MKIGGFRKFSLIDYPGTISAVIFTQGCNFRCGYCHNPQLVLPELFEEPIDENTITEHILKRKGKIEGVVVSGGEPTIHKDLPEFISRIKQHGFKVKLDTNGTNPKMLQNLLKQNLLDIVAMDLKTVFQKYKSVCNTEVNIQIIKNSIELLKKSGIEIVFRTTVLKGIHSFQDLRELKSISNNKLIIQNFQLRNKNLVSLSYTENSTFTESELSDLIRDIN